MHTPFLTEIAQEKMRRAIVAAQAPNTPGTVRRRTGISRWIRSLAIAGLAWRPSRRHRPARGPMADPAFPA